MQIMGPGCKFPQRRCSSVHSFALLLSTVAPVKHVPYLVLSFFLVCSIGQTNFVGSDLYSVVRIIWPRLVQFIAYGNVTNLSCPAGERIMRVKSTIVFTDVLVVSSSLRILPWKKRGTSQTKVSLLIPILLRLRLAAAALMNSP